MRRRNEDQKMVISWMIVEDMMRRDWESGLFAAMDLGFMVIFWGKGKEKKSELARVRHGDNTITCRDGRSDGRRQRRLNLGQNINRYR